ncbi:hypothetical protein UNDYM_1194 [Undibacterium sp. YM2]|uniref:hypothetical protein n=1 Tax=Undibacterium sp. YM2 TaxID=2058625 RepID=UPI001331E1AD|nr:hypothetical protein [Undibacterium sp. YM2]BBB65447.1 hypothetical protein UNDYM_1194 [Undibacterium sp. YM2]
MSKPMNKLIWRTGKVSEIPELLMAATMEKSAAIGAATVYHFKHDGQEKLAISLPDGQALIIEPLPSGRPRRRRVDPLKAELPDQFSVVLDKS